MEWISYNDIIYYLGSQPISENTPELVICT